MIDGLLNQVPNQTLQKYDVPIYDVKYDVTVFFYEVPFLDVPVPTMSLFTMFSHTMLPAST